MDEVTVRVARAIACAQRLRILSALSRVDEISPTELARQLRLSRHLLSAHLRCLWAVGLIQRRRSGAWHYCRAGSACREGSLSSEIASWLGEILCDASRTIKRFGLQQVRNAPARAADTLVRRVVFDAATAFTSVRRLQILRWLSSVGAADAATLCRELHMSSAAASRHTAKLIRRGYVVGDDTGRRTVYRLAPTPRTALHARFFDLIRRHWGEGAPSVVRSAGRVPKRG